MLYEKLYPKQKAAVDFGSQRRSSGLLFEQGTGKTWITAGIIERISDEDLEALLIVPLTNIETTWLRTLQTELPFIHTTQSWTEFKKLPTPKILLRHYESMRKIEGAVIRKGKKKKWSLIGFDEAQRLKGRGTWQSRMAKKLRDKAYQKIILTGTAIEKDPQDLWAQMRFLAPEALGDRYSDFDDEYLTPTGYMGYKRKFREEKYDQFIELVSPYLMRAEKTDVFDLPPMHHHVVPVTLIGKQKKTYRSMENNLIAKIGDRRVVALLKVTQIVKLAQITGGFIIENISLKEKEVHSLGRSKIRRLMPLVKRLEKPIVIFCKHREDIAMVKAAVKPKFKRLAILHGGIKKKDRAPILDAFQAGKYDTIICQTRTGGVGIDLYRSSNVIIYSTGHSYIDYEQLISRVHRHGQENEVNIYWLQVKNSIDEDIYNAVLDKRLVADVFYERIKKRRKDYDQKAQSHQKLGHQKSRRKKGRRRSQTGRH